MQPQIFCTRPLGEDFSSISVQNGDTWRDLARLCGCLPVALKAAGSYLACTPGSSPKKYIQELQDEHKRLGIIGKEGVEEDLTTKLSLSYGRLAPDTARIFRQLSVFPADFDAEAEEAICRDEGHRHLIELVRWSLVDYQRHSEEGEDRYHLHDLVRIYAACKLERDEKAAMELAHQLHSAYYLSVLHRANELLLKGGEDISLGLKLFDLEWTNIQAGQAWAKSHSDANPECSEYVANMPGKAIYWI